MKQILPIIAAIGMLCNPATGNAATQQSQQKPKAYLVSDAHLDTQWNWDIQTTISEYVRNTITQNLFLLKKYPDYIFNFEGGVKYSWMKEYYPQQYEELKKYVTAGQWHICGASWEASDAIVPSVESAIRNILLGQQFYRNEFGVESTDIFLPDCFGFGWTLPTIANHCGLIGFSSQKLGWRHNPFHGNKKYPFTIGLWKGVDGAEIMMAHGFNYGQRWNLEEDLTRNESLMRCIEESPLNMTFHYYGTGDIGGSPTMNSVDAVSQSIKADGPIEIISAESDRIFRDFMPYSSHPELPTYDGELLMDVHGTGCYTSQAAMKLYNRQNELLGDAAERAAVAACIIGAAKYPSARLTEAWRRFIFHQFHDDLTGTSIPRAYEFSWNDELLSLKEFSDILTASVSAVADRLDTRTKGTPIVLFNPLGYEVTDIVEISIPAKRCPTTLTVFDPQGKKVSSQITGFDNGLAKILVEASVPANGFAIYDVRLSGSSNAVTTASEANSIENSVYRIQLDDKGDITSLLDKRSGKELVKQGKAIRLALFTENKSFVWPAWEILKETVDATPVSIEGNVKASLTEQGPLRTTLRVEKSCGSSRFVQYIRLYEGALADRIDFFNEVDWTLTNALLKAEFPLSLDNEVATYDLGIGTIQRGNNTPTAYEVYSQRWADLTDKSLDYGLTVMNDCKYGWDKPDNNTLRLTLIHTPATDKSYPYQNRQDMGYHTFTYSICGHNGALDNSKASADADRLNQRIKAFSVEKHAGDLGKTFSVVSSSSTDVAIKALKMAEESDEYVVRVYETSGKSNAKTTLAFNRNIVSASKADGTEKSTGSADFSGNLLNVDIHSNGINTYKVKLASDKLKETQAYPLTLPFNKKCFSWNEMSFDADFEGGFSYAAELIPSELNINNIPFRLENTALLNGLECNGDTIALPIGHSYNRLYILAAAALPDKSTECSFSIGNSTQSVSVPSYTGFIGQWGHTGHTEGYLDNTEVAFTGTHRHSSEGDHPYEFTYMFKFGFEVPKGATRLILPKNNHVVLFAATLAEEAHKASQPLAPLFRTSIRPTDPTAPTTNREKVNLLKPEYLSAWSGYVNNEEHPSKLIDNDPTTKWCDNVNIPAFVEFDFGHETEISSWKVVNAAIENNAYITTSCLLQVRNATNEEWRTIDYCVGNKRNIISRDLPHKEHARYLRLTVVQPTQSADASATRIYELAVY